MLELPLVLVGAYLIGSLSFAVIMSRLFGLPDYTPALAGLAAFAGHLWPIFFGFAGGKGVATALGLLMALNPWLGLACLVSWVLVFGVTRISSLSALTAAGLSPVYVWFLNGNALETAAIAVLAGLIFWRHKANIGRLMRGEESAIKKKS